MDECVANAVCACVRGSAYECAGVGAEVLMTVWGVCISAHFCFQMCMCTVHAVVCMANLVHGLCTGTCYIMCAYVLNVNMLCMFMQMYIYVENVRIMGVCYMRK